jgi:sugar lactone lactonase YvrE
MKKNIILFGLACLAAMLFLTAARPPQVSGAENAGGVSKPPEPRPLYTISNGKADAEMLWFTDNGKAEPGHLQGPCAVLALNDNLRLFADTLNQRLVLRNASDGKVLKIFNFSQSQEVELKYKPLIISLADAGNGIIYAVDESNALIWKIDLDKNWLGPQMKTLALIPLKDKIGQPGKIWLDHNGTLYMADMPAQHTISFNPDGTQKFIYHGLTNGIPDRGGFIYHPIYYGDNSARDIEVFDSAGKMVRHAGRLKFDRPICYITPIGFDSEDTLYILADSDEKGPLAVRIFNKDEKQVFTDITPVSNPVFSSAPYWIGPAGSLEWAEYKNESIEIYRNKL